MTKPQPLSPEIRLLLHALREPADDEALPELLDGTIDWPTAVTLAERERALPALWNRLEGLPEQYLPAPIATRVRQLAFVSQFRMGLLQRRLDETLHVLADAGIEVILLKGAGLATTVYPSFQDRPMEDLDLMVKRDRAGEAWALVRGIGWHWDHNERLDTFYADHHHYPPLDDERGTGAGLELHTHLFPEGHPFTLPVSTLWDRAEQVPGRPDGVFVLSRHHQILHLCLHFAWSHKLSDGFWRTFRDLDALCRTGAIDWAEFSRLATWTRAASCCYWTLRLAKRMAGLDVPDDLLDELRPPGTESLHRLLERHYMANLNRELTTCPSVRLLSTAWEMGIRPRWSGHGTSRPWSRTAMYVEGMVDEDDAESPTTERASHSRLVGQLLRYRDWIHYLRLLT